MYFPIFSPPFLIFFSTLMSRIDVEKRQSQINVETTLYILALELKKSNNVKSALFISMLI